MITFSNKYQFHDIQVYLDGKENAKMTGYQMKITVLSAHSSFYAMLVRVCTRMYQYVHVQVYLKLGTNMFNDFQLKDTIY
jgi:hypothetical protein